MAIDNYEQAETLLETMPTSVKAPKPDVAVNSLGEPEKVFAQYGKGTDEEFRAVNRAKREGKQK